MMNSVTIAPTDRIFVQIPIGHMTSTQSKKYMADVVDALHAAVGISINVTALAIPGVEGEPDVTLIHLKT